jgi:hypothetical protein
MKWYEYTFQPIERTTSRVWQYRFGWFHLIAFIRLANGYRFMRKQLGPRDRGWNILRDVHPGATIIRILG